MRHPIACILGVLAFASAACGQMNFTGNIAIQFAGGAPSSVTVTPSGGAAQTYAISPATQPSASPAQPSASTAQPSASTAQPAASPELTTPMQPATSAIQLADAATPSPSTQPTLPPGSAIPTSSGDIYLQAGGVYQLPASLYISAANWRLHGNGATILSDQNGDTMLALHGDSDTIDNVHFDVPPGAPLPNAVEIDGSNDSATNCSAGIVSDFFLVTKTASDVQIENCTCPRLNQYDVYDDHATNVTIDRCHFGDPVAQTGSDEQHLIRGGGTHIAVTNCVLFDPLKSDGSQQNVIDAQIGDWTVTGNTIGKPGVESSGVWLGPLKTNDPVDCPATGPTVFSGNTVYSTFVELKAPSSGITINGNTFNRANQPAIYVNANVGNVAISNNTWIDSGPWGQFVYIAAGAGAVSVTNNNGAGSTLNMAGTIAGQNGAGWWYQTGALAIEGNASNVTCSGNVWPTTAGGDVIGWINGPASWKSLGKSAWQAMYPGDAVGGN